jgi:hypothetical protein
MLTCSTPVGGHGTARTLRTPSTRAPGPAVHRADARTHTRVGRRELAREWRVETDWEMKEPKEPKPALGQNGLDFQRRYAVVLFARSLCLVTAESTCSRQGEVILDIHDVSTPWCAAQCGR